MNHFDPQNMLTFDLETTTNDPMEAHIVTSAIVSIKGRSVEPLELLADPGVPISEAATKVHGISTDYAREHGRPHDEVLRETIDRIYQGWSDGQSLVVFNGTFDLTILRQRSQDFVIKGLVYDPYVIDKAKDPYRKGRRTLGSLCEFYGVRLDNAHEATADALAAARIAWKQLRMWPELAQMDADELMEQQAVWYYEQQSSLKKYLDSRGKDSSTVSTVWPMRG
ncbi:MULTISPECIES: 3'-5' exonuclease [Corynebacterium]|uniref:3'-5' exonuclease n=1 Tax=Corynebacterium TaxID=1716 RepID=UPI00124D8FAB|nr:MULTISPECIES: 3'-5' exonuclease [Corynebacterium]